MATSLRLTYLQGASMIYFKTTFSVQKNNSEKVPRYKENKTWVKLYLNYVHVQCV